VTGNVVGRNLTEAVSKIFNLRLKIIQMIADFLPSGMIKQHVKINIFLFN
jgi:hypothetical protein